MRFDHRENPQIHPLRKSRSRLTGLFIALALVIMGIQLAADPHTWSWFFPPAQDRQQAELDPDEISYNVTLDQATALRPDEFRSEPSTDDAPTVMSAKPKLLEGIDLSAVQDNTLGLRAAESEIQHTLLSRLREMPEGSLTKIAEPAPPFRAVMVEPDHYRGRVFEIRGLARRILSLSPVSAEDEAFPRYELWVFTRDSGINPWRIVTTAIPPELPEGLHDEGVPVRITGLFFKRQGYETRHHELHVAPLVLAKTVVYRPASPAEAASPANAVPWIFGGLILGGIGIAAFLWRTRRSDVRFEQGVLKKYQPDGNNPAEPETDPAIFLQQLSTKAKEEQDAPIRPGM